MSKPFMTKRKVLTSVVAVTLALVIVFGGTFAWQSISQEALNEVSATVNPGGRLHDDFKDITEETDNPTMTFDKDVYVENFTTYADNGVQVFARVRLDEYMEFGVNAGMDGNTTAKSLVDGATLDNKASWTTYIPGEDGVINDKSPFSTYWNWDVVTDPAKADTEGKVVYMPTFNKNKDSLEADINGTFDAKFADYTAYEVGVEESKNAIYDADAPAEGSVDVDELVRDRYSADAVIDGTQTLPDTYTQHVTLKEETHAAQESLGAYVITMQEWLELSEEKKTGNFWVWDTDGWAYWANPISPETATGVLLDGISRKQNTINEDWYYAINVVAQFITKDDIGYENSTGFYADGETVSANAMLLLNEIGVDVTFQVSTADELATALDHGGNIVLNNDVTVTNNLVVSADTTLNMNGHTIQNTTGIYNEDTKVWSLISVQGADTTLTIQNGNFLAMKDDCFAVDVRDGAKVVINDGFFHGNISAVYVHTGAALINGGTFAIQQPNQTPGEGAHDQMINAYDASYANGTAQITICGGTFYGFNPENANDGDLVPTGFSVTQDVEGIFKVAKTGTN